VLEKGKANSIRFVQGRLNIGEPMATPLIRAVKRTIGRDGITIIDVPPGTSCPVIESINGSNFCLLVTEPTPFGLHDLKLAVELLKELKIRHGVLINRAGIGDGRVENYCEGEGVSVMAQIPFDREIAVLYSRGLPVWTSSERYRDIFRNMWGLIENLVGVKI
jgi:MinD superfamily P-loop ATPase